MGILKFYLSIFMLCASTTFARPVSYSNSFTFMSSSNDMKESLYIHYSPSFRHSIGVEILKDKMFDTSYGLVRYTHLLFRKNTSKSQTNFYLNSGLGLNKIANFSYGIQGDWETRKYFFGFNHNRNTYLGSKFYDQYFTFGIVPYVGKYGDLHTWIMLKSKKNSQMKETHTYPIIKFFKGNSLLEIGFDNREILDLFFVQRF